ncbi:hypothetical protein DFH29DRAFT_799598 [Suillus ampliporus]|nr:hypothetical protein DFH29DRAFT_799598 [Suillus ampliporus]
MGEDGVLSEQRTICVAQYWRGLDSNGQRMPLHWALFAISNANQVDHWGTCYQAIGNTDTFTYSCMEDECMEILADGYRGCLVVGKIDSFPAEAIDTLLKQVTVYRGRENWNCQNWVLAALERLKCCNYVASSVSRDAVRHELEDILNNWIE